MSNEPLAPIPPPNGPWPTPQPKLEPTPEQRVTGILTCPYCGHKFPLTWGIYLSHSFTFGRICPQCKVKADEEWTKPYIIWLVVLAGVGVLVGVLICIRNFNDNFSINTFMSVFQAGAASSILAFRSKIFIKTRLRQIPRYTIRRVYTLLP